RRTQDSCNNNQSSKISHTTMFHCTSQAQYTQLRNTNTRNQIQNNTPTITLYHNVDLSVLCDDLVDSLGVRGVVEHVERHNRCSGHGRSELVELVYASGGEHDLGSVRRHLSGEELADAAGGAHHP